MKRHRRCPWQESNLRTPFRKHRADFDIGELGAGISACAVVWSIAGWSANKLGKDSERFERREEPEELNDSRQPRKHASEAPHRVRVGTNI